MSKGGHYLKKKAKQPKRGGKIALIIVCVLVVVLAAAAIAGVRFYNSMLDKIKRVEVVEQDYTMTDELLAMMGTEPPTEATEAATEPTTVPTTVSTEPTVPKEPDILNVLVTGQSYREGEDSRLADTIILVTINKDTKVVTLTSFLRDTYVDLPDYMGHPCGWNRINTNYALGYVWGGTGGAMEMTNLCLKNNFGIEVDYNVEVDFEVFKKVIDVLGGIRITLTEAEAEYINEDRNNWQDVVPGENRLYGDAALSYARMRKAEGDSDSDIKRTARQRNLMQAVITKIIGKGVTGVQELADEILPMIATNMTNEEITGCMLDLLPIMTDLTFEMGTCPVEGTYWSEGKETPDGFAYVLCFDSGQQKNLMMPITEGTPAS